MEMYENGILEFTQVRGKAHLPYRIFSAWKKTQFIDYGKNGTPVDMRVVTQIERRVCGTDPQKRRAATYRNRMLANGFTTDHPPLEVSEDSVESEILVRFWLVFVGWIFFSVAWVSYCLISHIRDVESLKQMEEDYLNKNELGRKLLEKYMKRHHRHREAPNSEEVALTIAED